MKRKLGGCQILVLHMNKSHFVYYHKIKKWRKLVYWHSYQITKKYDLVFISIKLVMNNIISSTA